MTFAVATATFAQPSASDTIGPDDSVDEAQASVQGHEVQDNASVKEAEVSADSLKRLELQAKADERDEIVRILAEIKANKAAIAQSKFQLSLAEGKLKAEQGAKTNAALKNVQVKVPKIVLEIAGLAVGAKVISKALIIGKDARYMTAVRGETPELRAKMSEAMAYGAGGAAAAGLGGASLLTDKETNKAVLKLVQEGNASALVELGRLTTEDIQSAKLALRDASAKLTLSQKSLEDKLAALK